MAQRSTSHRQFNLSRRSFLQASAITAAIIGLSQYIAPEVAFSQTATGKVDPEVDGKWITCDCWDNCGGRCVNKVLVSDGVAIRQKTDDTHPDSFDWPQQRSCPRGHSQRMQVFGVDRLKYPMKRKHWEPITGGDKSLRGKDEWERISWDEALDYVANELKHIKENYGNRAIFAPHRPDPRKQTMHNLMSAYGGYVQDLDSHSYGVFGYDMAAIGIAAQGATGSIDRYSLQKCKNIVLYAANPVWASAGNPAYYLWEAKKHGSQFVYVGPEYNVSAALYDARWIPVRPGTDVAFLLGVAHTMLEKDDPKTNPIIDWDFLNKYTVGFNGEHMPSDAKLNENFKDYVLGKYDNTPKTAQWASEICGTPVEDIEWYADLMSKQNSVGVFHSFGPARCHGAEGFPQLFYTIGAMGGHMGRVGHAYTNCNEQAAFDAGPYRVMPGDFMPSLIPNPIDDWIAAPEVWDAIMDGHYTYTGNCLYGSGTTKPAEERDLDIHMIWHSHEMEIQTLPNVNRALEAHRKVDFVLADSLFFNPSAQYADIVLPACTPWESWAPGACMPYCNSNTAIFPSKVVDPLYESKSTFWIARELAKRLDIDPDTVVPVSEEQQWFNYLAAAMVMNDKGEYAPLATLTDETIKKYEKEMGIKWPSGPQKGLIDFEQLVEDGVYTAPRKEDDGLVNIGWMPFVNDPEANPLPSKSGKLEIYCQVYADECNMQKRSEIKPYPTYTPAPGTYQSSFTDWDQKKRGDYTFQVFTPHYLRRQHTCMDNNPWMREALENPIFMNEQDAADLGVATGDTVKIHNERGAILRQVQPSRRFMRGVVAIPHGSWVDMDEEGVDHAGTDNVLCGGPTTGWGVSGYNTTLVAIEKYRGKQLKPDCELPPRIVKLGEE